MKPVLPKDQPGTPVYSTTLEQWQNHIGKCLDQCISGVYNLFSPARNGIPKGDNDWIEVSRVIHTEEFLLGLSLLCVCILIYLTSASQISMTTNKSTFFSIYPSV